MTDDPVPVHGYWPQAFLDGGSEEWGVLSAAIQRRVAGLRPGAVLEVIVTGPRTQAAIAAWCGRMGHDLLQRTDEDNRCRFWIRKHDQNL